MELYFGDTDWKKYFLTGSCYWFANYLYMKIENSLLMIKRMDEHCALYFENGLYDVRGKISCNHFHVASEREISFMKKNYVPKFDVQRLENYLKMQNEKMHKI